MTIEVVLSAYLTKYLSDETEGSSGDRRQVLEFDGPVTTEDILGLWKIPREEAAIYTFNEQRIEWDTPIDADGTLRIFPSIIGG